MVLSRFQSSRVKPILFARNTEVSSLPISFDLILSPPPPLIPPTSTCHRYKALYNYLSVQPVGHFYRDILYNFPSYHHCHQHHYHHHQSPPQASLQFSFGHRLFSPFAPGQFRKCWKCWKVLKFFEKV